MVGIAESNRLIGESQLFTDVDTWKGLLTREPKGTDSFRQRTRHVGPLKSFAFGEQVKSNTERMLRLQKAGRERKIRYVPPIPQKKALSFFHEQQVRLSFDIQPFVFLWE